MRKLRRRPGACSKTDGSAAGVFQSVVLTLRIPLEGHDVVCNGEVVYSNPGRGVGVNFQGLSDEDRGHLERALASR